MDTKNNHFQWYINSPLLKQPQTLDVGQGATNQIHQ